MKTYTMIQTPNGWVTTEPYHEIQPRNYWKGWAMVIILFAAFVAAAIVNFVR